MSAIKAIENLFKITTLELEGLNRKFLIISSQVLENYLHGKSF
ncbi:hypothetical protein N9U60_02525 [Betaproteobacteria bacterium]|nr:hypothetical protein [Betaproteobacteria bacterium]